MSRLSQVDSSSIPPSNYLSRLKRDSPNSTIYRHSAASSIDSGRSSTAIYDSPKVRRFDCIENMKIDCCRRLLYRVLLGLVMLVRSVVMNRNHPIRIKQVIEVRTVVLMNQVH